MILENITLSDIQNIFDLLPSRSDVKSIIFDDDKIIVNVSFSSSDVNQICINAKLNELNHIIENLK